MHLDEEVREIIVEPIEEPKFLPSEEPQAPPEPSDVPAVPAEPQKEPAHVRAW